MKITDHIKKANKKTLFSFEIIPPKKGNSIQDLYNNIDPLMEFEPPFIDVTTSREEYVYIDKGEGLLDRKITRMRPGTVGICAARRSVAKHHQMSTERRRSCPALLVHRPSKVAAAH